MTEPQAGRPPVAPKPPSLLLNSPSNAKSPAVSPGASPALRGAASAFGPGLVKGTIVSPNQNATVGARLAAAAAAASKHVQPTSPRPIPQNGAATTRGRAWSNDKIPVAASLRSPSISPPKATRSIHPQWTGRSPSAVAAATASARTSPSRQPTQLQKTQTGSNATRTDAFQESRRRGYSTSSNTTEARIPLSKSSDALAGAVASMHEQHTGGQASRIDISHPPRLPFQSTKVSTESSPARSGASASAAALATKNAALAEPKKPTPPPPSRRGSPPPMQRFKSSESNLSRSGSSTHLSTGGRPLNAKATPVQTDSEAEPGHRGPGPPVAPKPNFPPRTATPINPSQAAGTAMLHDQAKPTVQRSATHAKLPTMTASNLADAMVAGSLASSMLPPRVSSPAVPPPVPKPRRRSRSVGLFDSSRHLKHHNAHVVNNPPGTPVLKPAPPRPMRQTLRNHTSDKEDEEEESSKHGRGRRHWVRNPNMHHEGDRRRWREKLTDRERKRYEGVWAANRGLLQEYDLHDKATDREPGDLVLNIVVRDIFERSRLPRDVLEEVWDLVATEGAKSLSREEFCVGLWLVDQRLKGRKLPFKVSASVWNSVRHVGGVKVREYKDREHKRGEEFMGLRG